MTNADLEQRCIAAIEAQNWTDQALTDEERHLIRMAVSWTANVMRRDLSSIMEKLKKVVASD